MTESAERELPEPIGTAATRVRTSTRSLIAAAAAGDADGIRRAIEKRGDAVDALLAALDEDGKLLTEPERRDLIESLALGAQDAATDLGGLMERIRDDLLSMARGGQAATGYSRGKGRTDRLDDPSSLDLSG